MCGFTGFVDFNLKSSENTLKSMADVLSHRGPNDSGYVMLNDNYGQIGLGFRRLSIIDLSSLGHQPMKSENGDYILVFNGEIYNYKEIKKELENDGLKFDSDSDTEVILKSYIKWGSDCVYKFIGMFAFAIYDKVKQEVLIFRDRAGVKPLFYYFKDGLFLFASELKAFHKHPDFKKELNFDSLALYFQNGYISAPYSIFNNVWKLKPGCILKISLENKTLKEDQYWNIIDFYNKPYSPSFPEALERTEELLKSAFNYRMVADVPVGVFLSGGIDSSIVTAILQKDRTDKLKTFTIGFEETEFNEAIYAKKVSEYLGTDHNEYLCTYKDALNIIPHLPEIYDEPFADYSSIPTILVSRYAKESVTVALSADGGDEIFAGYTKYNKVLKYLSYLERTPGFAKQILLKLVQTSNHSENLSYPDKWGKLENILSTQDSVKAFNIITQGMTQKEVSKLILKPFELQPTPFEQGSLFSPNVPSLNRFLATDFYTFLIDDVLQKVDRATMSASLEGREPFLDHRLMEYVAGLPTEYKLKERNGKYLLKEIAYKYIPRELIERPKMGFSVPISQWFKKDLKDLLLHYLNEKLIIQQGIFSNQNIQLMVKAFFEDKNVQFDRIWKVIAFQMWYERWMDKN